MNQQRYIRIICDNALCDMTTRHTFLGFGWDFYRFKAIGGWTCSFILFGFKVATVNCFEKGKYNGFWW